MIGVSTLSVRDLQGLVVLAQTRHFGRAAERLGMAQPSFSALIRRAEEALGMRLFDRTSRSCALTPDGVLVIDEVRGILERIEALPRLRTEGGAMTGPVRLGQIPTLGPYLTPHVLPGIRAALPDLQIYFTEAFTGSVLDMVRDGRLDAGILTRPIDAPDLILLPLFEEELVLAVPHGHRLAGRRRVAGPDIRADELILLERGHCLRSQTLAALPVRSGDEPAAHATGIETLRFMVAAGIGCAVLPALAADDAPGSLIRYVRFEEPHPTREVILVTRPEARTLRIGEALAGVIAGLPVPTAPQSPPAPPGSKR